VIAWMVAVAGSYVMNSYVTFAAESPRLRWKHFSLRASGILGVIANTELWSRQNSSRYATKISRSASPFWSILDVAFRGFRRARRDTKTRVAFNFRNSGFACAKT